MAMETRRKRRLLAGALAILCAAVPQRALAGGGPGGPAGGAPLILDRDFLLGAWTDDGDCSDTILFGPDGRYLAANGGTGRWELEGDRLTLSGGKSLTVRVVPVDRDRIDVVSPDGSIGHSTRCAPPPPESAPVVSDVT